MSDHDLIFNLVFIAWSSPFSYGVGYALGRNHGQRRAEHGDQTE